MKYIKYNYTYVLKYIKYIIKRLVEFLFMCERFLIQKAECISNREILIPT